MSDNNPNPSNPDKGKKRASYPTQPPPAKRLSHGSNPPLPERQSYPTPTPQGQPVVNLQSKMNAPQEQTGHPSNSPLGKRPTFYSYAAQQQRPSQPAIPAPQGRMNFSSQPSYSPLQGQPGLNTTSHPLNFQPGRRPTRDESGAQRHEWQRDPSRGQPGSDAAAELKPFVKPQPRPDATQQQAGQPRRPTFQPDPQRHEWPTNPIVSTQPGPGATQQPNAELATPHRSLDQPQGERGHFTGGPQSAGSGGSMQVDAGERMEGVESEVQQPNPEAQQPQAADQPEQGKKSKVTQEALALATTTYSQPPEQEHNTAGGMMDDMERYKEGERLMDEWKRSQGKCEYLMCRLPEGRHEDFCIGAGKKE